LRVRFSLWRNNLPLDSLPAEGAITVPVFTEEQLLARASGENWKA